MKIPHVNWILCLGAWLASACSAWAQQAPPHIGYLYPAGARQGATLEVMLGGQHLAGIRRVYVSGSGVQASFVSEIKLPPMGEGAKLRDKLRELMNAPRDSEKENLVAEIEKKLYSGYLMETRRATPAISETVLLRITVAADAEPGRRELRVATQRGLSNRLTFCVGTVPEFYEPEPVLPPEPKDARVATGSPPYPTLLDITLPAVVNGQIIAREPNQPLWTIDRFTPGDADRYRFHARKGQQLVVAVSARDLLPYLPDAVPGWFQPTLALFDARGRELAYEDDYRFHPDPVLFYKIREDGQYSIEIKDAIYRGRHDFVYRIAVGELPFVTSIFPLGGRAGQKTTVELTGWNLPAERVTMDAMAPRIHPLSVRKGGLISNRVPLAVDTLPECLEQQSNDSPTAAQTVTPPMIVNGRIDRPGDWDVFRLEGRAGQRIIAETFARRLDSPLDSVLELIDAAGKRLAFNDDHQDRSDALKTHYADSLIDFTLPGDGVYFLRLGDAQREGGPEYAYRLRISPPRPDFALRVVPSHINAVSRHFVPINVFALRRDGFAGEIALRLKDAPEDFSISGGLLPAGQDQVPVTLLIPPTAPGEPMRLCLEGRATIGGREVVHAAVPADDMMQAFAYTHLVPAEELTLLCVDRASSTAAGRGAERRATRSGFRSSITLVDDRPVRIPAGGTVEVRVNIPATSSPNPIQVELSNPPVGIGIDKVSPFDKGVVLLLRGEAGKARPGLKGNLIAVASQQRSVTQKDGKKHEYRSVMGTLPAIPFEVVQP